MSRLVLVEDDERIGSSLQRALLGLTYEVDWFKTGDAALKSISMNQPDMIILDLGLPDVDGMVICKQLHSQFPNLPIFILTARQEESDIVAALDFGAIDYLTKPFSLAELTARIRAHLRQVKSEPGILAIGNLAIDLNKRKVFVSANELPLRPKEFDVLERLARDAGKIVRRETLMSDVWDINWFGSTKTLDFHIAGLRSKLEAADASISIETSRSVGYLLTSR